jgi:hypothetical protein
MLVLMVLLVLVLLLLLLLIHHSSTPDVCKELSQTGWSSQHTCMHACMHNAARRDIVTTAHRLLATGHPE